MSILSIISSLFMFFIIAFVLIAIIILIMYNSLVKDRNSVKQSRAAIDVYLKQRFDLIPNLIECVNAYSSYEKGTLEHIIKLRTQYIENRNTENANNLNNELNKLLIVSENYPELKSNENFLNLQKNLSKIEDQLQGARRLYNIDVTTYNTAIQSFPTNIIAKLFNFEKEDLFEVSSEETQNVNIKF